MLKMNDPHVVALEYRIEHGPGVDWSSAAPLEIQSGRFDIRVENRQVRIDLKDHYSTEREARSAVETDFIPNWEFEVGLNHGPDAFSLRFDHAEIVDRDPPPGPPAIRATFRSGVPRVRVSLGPRMPAKYPEPPHAPIRRSPDVDTLYQRFLGHLEGKEPLPGMAYFCLTLIENMGGGPHKAPARFGVSRNVLVRVRKLSSRKGGASARKEGGRNEPYTDKEEWFLKSAIKMLIWRVAEVEHGPDSNRAQITMDDLERRP